MSKIFKIMHMVGLLFVGTGAGLYFFSSMTNEVSGMLLVACLIGLGFVVMAPYPVVLVFEWAQKQQDNANEEGPKT